VVADYSAIGGGIGNTNFGYAGTISGGESSFVGDSYATVSGGRQNSAATEYSTVAGGWGNVITGARSVIGGGLSNTNTGSTAVIGGGELNRATNLYATVAGGFRNIAGGVYGTVGGGFGNFAAGSSSIAGGVHNVGSGTIASISGGSDNLAGGHGATIGGGLGNTNLGGQSFIGGGLNNYLTNDVATIAGGSSNTNNGYAGAIGGGSGNAVIGGYAAIPGGDRNVAGLNAFAAGHRAKATNQGAFVWADSTDADFNSTGNNQFLIRASGGVGIGTSNPTAKLHIAGVAGTDGLRFPDGSFQTTAPFPLFASGFGSEPATTNRFLSATVTVTVNSLSQRILVTSNKAFGSFAATGADGLNLYIGYRTNGSPAEPQTVGTGIFGNRVAANTRVTMGLSAVITSIPPGTYEVGLVGSSAAATNWNFNEFSYTTATLY
jgi:hypothetical protein